MKEKLNENNEEIIKDSENSQENTIETDENQGNKLLEDDSVQHEPSMNSTNIQQKRRRISEETINNMRLDYESGYFTQQQIADKYKRSIGSVNYHLKDIKMTPDAPEEKNRTDTPLCD